jgi:hypothetical protein
VWSAEKRAEGLEYMHPKPSSHSGRIVGNPEVIQVGPISNDKSASRYRLVVHCKRVNRY